MRTYETTFIINPQTDDAQIDRQVTDITDLIKTNGGEIKCENRIGTRRMAYAIQGLTQGYYTQLFYEAPQDALPVLDRHFKLEDPYIRFMTVLFEGPVPTLEEINRPPREDDSRDKRRDDDDARRGRNNRSGRREERSDDTRPETNASAPKEETPAVKNEETEKTEQPETPAETEAPVETEAPAETEAPVETSAPESDKTDTNTNTESSDDNIL